MKYILLFISFCLTIPAFAQTAKQPATTNAPTEKDIALCQQWKLLSTEQFGVKHDLSDAQKNDAVSFMADKTLVLTMDGKNLTGTWTADKAKTFITITLNETKEQMRLKVISLDKQHFSFDHKDKSEFHTIYTYEPAKKN